MKSLEIVNSLLEDDPDDLDAPDLQYWGKKLSPEHRLDQMLGAGKQYFKDDPDAATQWHRLYLWGPLHVAVQFTIFYKRAKVVPCAGLRYELWLRDWTHLDHEMVYGDENVLKMAEMLEKILADFEATPPQTVTKVIRAFEVPMTFARNQPYPE